MEKEIIGSVVFTAPPKSRIRKGKKILEQVLCVAVYEPHVDIKTFILRLGSLDQAMILPEGTGVSIRYKTGNNYRSVFPLKAIKASSVRGLKHMEMRSYFSNLKTRKGSPVRQMDQISPEQELWHDWIDEYQKSMHLGTSIFKKKDGLTSSISQFSGGGRSPFRI